MVLRREEKFSQEILATHLEQNSLVPCFLFAKAGALPRFVKTFASLLYGARLHHR